MDHNRKIDRKDFFRLFSGTNKRGSLEYNCPKCGNRVVRDHLVKKVLRKLSCSEKMTHYIISCEKCRKEKYDSIYI